jgi:hypothetical protein
MCLNFVLKLGAGMPDSLWVGLILIIIWASLPISLIISNRVFDRGVIRPDGHGDDHHH